MYKIDLSGKSAIVFGIANQRSIAWSIAKILSASGAKIIAAYQNDRVKDSVEKLTSQLEDVVTVECDVSDEGNVQSAFETVKENCETLDALSLIHI